jgi:PAS domain S-box-containing protein
MKPSPAVLVVGLPVPSSMDEFAGSMRAHGISIRTITSGLQALARIRTHPPAVVVLSFDLPDIDGLDVLRRLKSNERSRGIPVLFVAKDLTEQNAALKMGAADVLPAPWQDDEWSARIRTHVELATLRECASRGSLGLHPSAAVQSPGWNGGWISLAMQAGRMYGFEWDAVTDEVLRSQSCVQVLAAPDAARDTGENWFRRIHPDDVERLRGVLSILSPAYDAYDMNYRVQRSDGQWITVHESSRGFFDSSNRLIRLTGVVVDVSEQVRAERDLVAMQRDLLSLVEKLPIAVAITNEHGTIEYINESFSRTFGYRLEEIADPTAWWRLAYPDEQYRHAVIAAWEQAVRVGGGDGHDIPAREYLITGKDGATHTVEVFGAVLGHRKLVLFNDITERKQAEAELRESEERFRLMADTAPIMLWIADIDRRYTFFNRGWLEFTGRTLSQELGTGWTENVHPDDLERCIKMYCEAFDSRRRFQMEIRLRRADGEYGCVLYTGVPRFESNGAFAGYIGSALDLTEFKRQQEHMLAMQKLESLGVIASGIAHDFNNLLSCILVDASETESELEPGSPAHHGLQRIEAVAVRASEIVRQIMAYAGQGRQEMEAVDLVALVREMLRLLQVCMPKNVRLDLRLPDNLPPIKANAPQIRQVVMNLVLNAAEAFGEHEGTVLVTASRLLLDRFSRNRDDLAEGEYVCLEILDNGLGMTEEIQNRIFDPFFTTKLEGRGLGLPAVQRIVNSHQGSIHVASAPGVGTTFEILLPCAEETGALLPSLDEGTSEISQQRDAAILIVEDEETLRLSVSQMLRNRGFTVLEAADGDTALNLIQSQGAEIGVLLLDLTLPGKSSLEVLEKLQKARPDAKVILTSAFEWENVEGRLRTLRHDNFIRKPYHLHELISLVRNAMLPVGAGSGHHGHSVGA